MKRNISHLPQISTLIPMAEDEDIRGYINALAAANCMDADYFCKAYIDSRRLKYKEGVYPSDLDKLCEKNQENGFPALKNLLYNHTVLMVEGLFCNPNVFGKRMDILINGSPADYLPKFGDNGKLRYCPECAKEDLKTFGRVIARVPHLVKNVRCCYKHGVYLTDDLDNVAQEIPSEQEIREAQKIANLFRNTPYGSLINIKKRAYELLYEKYPEEKYYRLKANDGGVNIQGMHAALALMTEEELRSLYKCDEDALISQAVGAIKEFSPETEVSSIDFPFITFRCGNCGRLQTMYIGSVLAGIVCPSCARKMTGLQRLQLHVRNALTEGTEVVSINSTGRCSVRCTKCGHVVDSYSIRRLVMGDCFSCPSCQGHLGEERLMLCGKKCRVTGYRSTKDIDVTFEDGIVLQHREYANFASGTIKHPGVGAYATFKDRTGERRLQKCGQFAEIIGYRGAHDIDVQFEDGMIKEHIAYSSFKSGRLVPGKNLQDFYTKSKVGERRLMNCGQYAEIVTYRSYGDIDVRFEDGSLREHKKYQMFKEGQVSPIKGVSVGWSSRLRADRVGEKRLMNCGQYAEIIAYRSYQDIDLKFEDGSIREHVKCKQFDNCQVSPVKGRSVGLSSQIKKDRVGERRLMNCGQYAEITEYRGCEDIDIMFEDGNIREHMQYDNFKRGRLFPVKSR